LYLKSVNDVPNPIVLNPSSEEIKIPRIYKLFKTMEEIKSETGISLKLTFGNGSLGNRGTNNKGIGFEGIFLNKLNDWKNGLVVENKYLKVIEILDKKYGLSKSKLFSVSEEGSKNTKRPLIYGSDIILSNKNGSGFDIGESIADLVIHYDKGSIYLSLKLGGTTTFFNSGITTVLQKSEIKSGEIKNKDGLGLLKILGIDQELFCNVFNGKGEPSIVKNANADIEKLEKLLQSGIGFNYFVIHDQGSEILGKEMTKSEMLKSSKITGPVTVYYGGKTGKGKRIDVIFKSSTYEFKLNIRDTQGTDGYPTRLMCDFKYI
jgi:hypothetical protein